MRAATQPANTPPSLGIKDKLNDRILCVSTRVVKIAVCGVAEDDDIVTAGTQC